MNRSLGPILSSLVLLLCATAHGQEPTSPSGLGKFTTFPAGDAATRFDQGRKWAVVVGVNEYLGTGIPALKYCVADAKLVAKQLIERCGYDEKRVLTLTDDRQEAHLRPLRINLDQKIRGWLSLAAEGDTVFVFFSGHGFLDERGQGFLAPQDCQLDNLGLSALRTDDLRDMLRQCKATQKILVLDCCHAGAGKGEVAGSSSQEIGGAFKSAAGLVTIASCRKKETSLEWEKQGQGLFTHFLSAGLGGAADFDRNGIVDNLELYRYLADEVPTTAQRELNGVQMPVQIIGDDVAGVFALSRVVAGPRPLVPPGGSGKPSENSIGMKFALIPAGEFPMGSRDDDAGAEDDEKPQRRVTIVKPYLLGMHEVTRGQFASFVAAEKFRTEAERDGQGGWGYDEATDELAGFLPQYDWRKTGFKQADDHPVVNVSWNDAQAFCAWLSKKEGRVYRLPTEAEWEYACRSGGGSAFSFGDDPKQLVAYGNVADRAFRAKKPGGYDWGIDALDGHVFTAPVGAAKPNAWGLYDMHGNVEEWCADAMTESTTDVYRACRGGGWHSEPQDCRSAARRGFTPDSRRSGLGFRVVLEAAAP